MFYQFINQATLSVNGFSLNLSRAILQKGDEEIHLTPKECKVLALLIQNAGQVVSRKNLMAHVWETDYLGDTRTLDVHICWLRQKLETDPKLPQYIVTKRGRGYILNV